MIEDLAYLGAGLLLLAAAGYAGWRSWAGPQKDWRRRRGTWVTAQVTRIVQASEHAGPPYVKMPARLQLRYTISDHAYSAKLALERTQPTAYTRWQHLEVFVPASNRRRPRTQQEDNFQPEQLNGSLLLVILGGLVVAAGIVGLIRGS